MDGPSLQAAQVHLPFPAERRFFFDPAWNPGRQVLLHPQPDRVWRIDWQVAPAKWAWIELHSYEGIVPSLR